MGFEPAAAIVEGWKAQTNPISYGGSGNRTQHLVMLFGEFGEKNG